MVTLVILKQRGALFASVFLGVSKVKGYASAESKARA